MFDKKTWSRQYYQDHKEEFREHKRQWYLNHREESNARCKHWRQTHPEQVIRNNQIAVNRTKLAILTYYSSTNPPSCARCGIDDIDVLCLDHINGGGSAQRKQLRIEAGTKNISFYNWIRKNAFPVGFQVLCFNCNMKKRIKEHL